MVWGVYSWIDVGPLIRQDTTLAGDTYIRIQVDHVHPLMSIMHTDGLGQFQQDYETPYISGIATRAASETLMNLNTSAGHQTP